LPTGVPMATKTVLLVEDDADVRNALATFLRAHGMIVSTATHGLDGLRKLAQEVHPAVIVADLMMPVMDGWDFLQRCPEGIPIVVLSGTADIQRTKAHPDVVAILQKPVSVDVLVKAVQPFVTA
jgi:CheY-like chemotaxis protein